MPPAKTAAQSRSFKAIFSFVRKRDGRIVPFDQSRITGAVLKALVATNEGALADAEKISDAIVTALLKKRTPESVPGIEEVQDVVETQLILMDYAKAAKAYILYRSERAKFREQMREVPERVKKLVKESKKYFRGPLSEFVYYRTYSRWIDEEGRRETWIETIDRYMSFMKERLGDLLAPREYQDAREAILKQEVMPSMRLLWSAGRAVRANHVAAFNCSFVAPARIEDFAEIMFLAMSGAGVGFSVESQCVQQFPQIKKQTGKFLLTHVVADSKEGWCDALTAGVRAWFNGKDIKYDFSKLRPQGARLQTMGGKSSGPEPLRALLEMVRNKIMLKQNRRLTTLDVHDIVCKIGEVVVVGGVRRTALISLSDLNDEELRHAKDGMFYIKEPQRAMANNSAVYLEKPRATEFMQEWLALAQSGSGERGIFNRGGLPVQMPARRVALSKKYMHTMGTNPCVTGDTLVYVADGRGHVPIEQLARESKDVPVFCRNNRGAVAIRIMRNPRRTGEHAPIYKVTLDDRSTIRTTANHRFLLKSGKYKEVQELAAGDSLSILTKFEASIKDVFSNANSRSQNYWWVNNGRARNIGEHRLIAAFHHNVNTVPHSLVIHHKDRDSQNNNPDNLEILSKQEHDKLHANLMIGDANPMRRAFYEWDAKKWEAYRLKHSYNSGGARNKNFSGITDNELRRHALALTKKRGRRFSHSDWMPYAKSHGLPQFFSKWRRDHLGGVLGLAQWAAQETGIEHIYEDPRVVASYQQWTRRGYRCEIRNGEIYIIKQCEACGKEFETISSSREFGMCSISCGLRKKWQNENHRARVIKRIHEGHAARKEQIREAQIKLYSELRFTLERGPLKNEWIAACKQQGISYEISRGSSPLKSYNALKEASSLYNHKVVSVEFCGHEDVYNGTVDEYHNFFVGGFASKTKNGKRKFIYLNNPQCGEITLRHKQFCNLSEVVCRREDTQESLARKIRTATVLGTYQCMLTDYQYLSKAWKKNCDEERLLGVSLTGQWDCPAVRNAKTLTHLREEALRTNEKYAKKFGINASASITCVKPSGNVSQLVDAASGMHPRHAPHYIRRVRIGATDSLFQMMKDQKIKYNPEVGQTEEGAFVYVLDFPVAAPQGAVYRDDISALAQLEHWHMVKKNYTEHNPSVTVSVSEDEWLAVADWLYKNWDMLGGLSFLPRDNHVYSLAPYEGIDGARYKEMAAQFPNIDFSQIVLYERDDQTQGAKEAACVAGVCEIA